MRFFGQWLLPIAFVGIGSAIWAGVVLPGIPSGTGLRPMLGIVMILMGLHRFVASRRIQQGDRRRYGGERAKPWEDS